MYLCIAFDKIMEDMWSVVFGEANVTVFKMSNLAKISMEDSRDNHNEIYQ